ncbi:hypothetical protein [Rhizobium sp. B21/90]|uniref:hypothetical protein n=1 Tax=Rhizobium sp. B21/90 TaxID=2819993 RepID=UPI001C5B8C9D|nr:hypothetical protein [Rhizobium sp. B21/90]QYA05722.1 hypothetical protein J5278_29735 [Rhizobium sp. B21/90]
MAAAKKNFLLAFRQFRPEAIGGKKKRAADLLFCEDVCDHELPGTKTLGEKVPRGGFCDRIERHVRQGVCEGMWRDLPVYLAVVPAKKAIS